MRTRDIREGRTYRTKHNFRLKVISIFPGEGRGMAEVNYEVLPGADAPCVGKVLHVDLEEFAERVDREEAKRKGGL